MEYRKRNLVEGKLRGNNQDKIWENSEEKRGEKVGKKVGEIIEKKEKSEGK